MILIFESHPVQYRAPLYRKVAGILGENKLKVIYGSDFSIRSYRDQDFGGDVEWNMDLTSGYRHQFLQTLRDPGLRSFRSLGGKGIKGCFEENAVDAILLTSLRFEFDFVALYHARRRGIPVFLRTETQDHAFERSKLKEWFRRCAYRMAYRWIDQVLPIGKLNAEHYRKHGKSFQEKHFVRYCVPNLFEDVSNADKQRRRDQFREKYSIPQEMWLVGFSGKFIPKKNPQYVLEAIALLNKERSAANKVGALMVGTGPLQEELQMLADTLKVPTWFPGFLDQEALPDAYLAMDGLMLPSRRMGETWGLVVNEALQAGCSVVVSDAVGSSAEFGDWERVRVTEAENVHAGAKALHELSEFSRDWNGCHDDLAAYSISEVALRMASVFSQYSS